MAPLKPGHDSKCISARSNHGNSPVVVIFVATSVPINVAVK